MRAPRLLHHSITVAVCALLLFVAALFAPATSRAQDAPDPRPDDVPYLYDAGGVFTEGELGTLRRDAELLQSSKIPTLVYVREVSAEQATKQTSQEFAEDVRQSWGIESAEGADDGLVLLFSWVPDNPDVSTVVQAYGQATFDNNGLTPASIQKTIDTSVRSLIRQGQPFETMVYLMRETRYTGIYAPPPPPALGDTAQGVHDALDQLAPVIAGLVALAFGLLSARFWKRQPASRQIWTIAGITLAGAVLLWLIAVRVQSDAGVASALAIAALLALTTWLWTHPPFTTRRSGTGRTRGVPGTPRRMRKQRQARAMQMRAAKVNR